MQGATTMAKQASKKAGSKKSSAKKSSKSSGSKLTFGSPEWQAKYGRGKKKAKSKKG
jgi:hypothetical protein